MYCRFMDVWTWTWLEVQRDQSIDDYSDAIKLLHSSVDFHGEVKLTIWGKKRDKHSWFLYMSRTAAWLFLLEISCHLLFHLSLRLISLKKDSLIKFKLLDWFGIWCSIANIKIYFPPLRTTMRDFLSLRNHLKDWKRKRRNRRRKMTNDARIQHDIILRRVTICLSWTWT